MTTYSRTERLDAIKRAGFADPITALAVSLAEFGENRDVNTQSQSDSRYANGEREESYGPWQIHLPAHPDVSRSCAMDLECSTQVAARLSKGGTDFGPWSAYTSGSFQRFMAELKDLVTPTPDPSPGSGDGGGAAPASGPAAVTGNPCADTPAALITNVKISLGVLVKGHGEPASIAEALKAMYPQVPVACLQSIAYGNADAIKNAPDQQAARAVGDAAANATKTLNSTGDLIKAVTDPANLWRAGFLILGAALLFFGARMYFHADTASEQAVEGGAS